MSKNQIDFELKDFILPVVVVVLSLSICYCQLRGLEPTDIYKAEVKND